MKSTLLFIFVLALFSCDSKKVNNEELSFRLEEEMLESEVLEIQIIQTILDEAKKVSPKPPQILIMEPGESMVDFQTRKDHLHEDIHNKWDKTTFEFIVIDTLFAFNDKFPFEFLDSTFSLDSKSSIYLEDVTLVNLTLIKQDGFKLIEQPKFDSLYFQNLGELFRKDEFNSIYSFSKMLFNSDKSQVIFSYSYVCGGHCGAGFVVKMRMVNDGWAVQESNMIWVA